jgi:predicted metal-binding protein
MRMLLAGVAAAAVVALSVPVGAATETITGKIVDQMCYTKDTANNHAADHKMPADVAGCAAACAKKGMPLALLTKDGKVYTIAGGLAAENNAKLIPHIAHTVSITGDVVTKGTAMTITAAELKMVSR